MNIKLIYQIKQNQSDLDTTNRRVTSTESSIIQLSDRIESKVSATDL